MSELVDLAGSAAEFIGGQSVDLDAGSAPPREGASRGPVVVGVDGSTPSERALLWAANQARIVGVGLRVVLVRPHAVPLTAIAPEPVWPWPVVRYRDEEDVADIKAKLTKIIEGTLTEGEEIDVEVDVIDGPVASCLIEIAEEAKAGMIVTGRRGIGGFKRLLLGSVSAEIATYATVPVVVIGKEPYQHHDQVIVAAVDGSEHGDRALTWAYRQAHVVGASLRVVHTWEPPYIPVDSLAGTVRSLAPDEDELRAAAQSVLDSCVARVIGPDPQVPVDTELRVGYPSEQLTQAAANAQLLVVGTRGLGGFSSLLLGSVAHQCLSHAKCPVAVVRPGRE
jgi:nucleotide-binding universal stress UspA family protein